MKLVKSKHVRITPQGWVGILVMKEGPEYRSDPERVYSLAYGWCERQERIFNGKYIVIQDKILVR